jgi:hypothetical protein
MIEPQSFSVTDILGEGSESILIVGHPRAPFSRTIDYVDKHTSLMHHEIKLEKEKLTVLCTEVVIDRFYRS